MFINTLDKLVFSILLLASFQLPLLANDYLQLVNGYFLSTQAQVEAYQLNAQRHEYSDVYAMIEDFKRNPNLAVRSDAQLKEQTMQQYQRLAQALQTLKHGNWLEKTRFMFSPSNWPLLREVSLNFQPGIPLNLMAVAYSFVTALLLGALLLWPLRRLVRPKRRF
ncbi:DUF2937 family protein [Agarivorans sp.]|uniref:DUF2937 family protein n=1 Tax=Agarivorans sp. TaxID=1872412 RepID=UPI003D066658